MSLLGRVVTNNIVIIPLPPASQAEVSTDVPGTGPGPHYAGQTDDGDHSEHHLTFSSLVTSHCGRLVSVCVSSYVFPAGV